MNRFDLIVNRGAVTQLLKRELQALRGLSQSEAELLLTNGMRDNIGYRLRTLKILPPDAQ